MLMPILNLKAAHHDLRVFKNLTNPSEDWCISEEKEDVYYQIEISYRESHPFLGPEKYIFLITKPLGEKGERHCVLDDGFATITIKSIETYATVDLVERYEEDVYSNILHIKVLNIETKIHDTIVFTIVETKGLLIPRMMELQ